MSDPHDLDSAATGDAAAAGVAPAAAPASSPVSSPAPPAPGPPFLRALGANLRAGALAATFRYRFTAALSPTPGQLVALLLAMLLLYGVQDLGYAGLDGRFYPASLPVVLFPVLLLMGCAWLILAPLQAMDQFLRLLVAFMAAILAVELPSGALFAALDHAGGATWQQMRPAATWVWLTWLWAAAVFVVAVLVRRAVAWAGLVLAVAWLWPAHWASQYATLWGEDWERGAAAQAPAWRSAVTEQVLARQPELLRAALEAVAPGRPGRTELFHLVAGLDGSQDVFVREAREAHRRLGERFGARNRGIVLANHPSATLELPFAHLTNLRAALATLAARMNPAEDVLLLYLTSHGSREHRLTVGLWPYEFDPIGPAQLRAALDEAGIRFRVVVVSACFSGGFVEALQGRDTAVFTAAAADRTSFGCADGRDWTYFGEAFFDHALPQSADLEQVFDAARRRVAGREQAEGHEPSQPQASVGEGARARLRALATATAP